MLKQLSALTLAAVLAALSIAVNAPATALAEDVVGTSSPPVLTVHSSGGTITLMSGEDNQVRVTSAAPTQAARVSRFNPSQMGETHIMLPEQFVRRRVGRYWRVYHLPARQFSVPMARFGSEGVNVENPGGDTTIAVPKRVGAVFINAESGNVAIEHMRGPYVISATGGDVRMLNVAGRGLIRTTSGSITLGGVAGDVHIQTANGPVTVYGSVANSVDVQTDSGNINWRFAKCGTGVYRFRSKEGAIHLAFRPQAAAQVDAQSDNGNVTSLFPAPTNGASAVASQGAIHAVSVVVNGGGPEITATTTSGDITIEPITDELPAKASSAP